MLNIIKHFQKANEVSLICWKRNPLQKNNFDSIPHSNINSSRNIIGWIRFALAVFRTTSDMDFDIGYCSSIRLIPILKMLAFQKKAVIVYDAIEIPSLIAAHKVTAYLKWLPLQWARRGFEVGEHILIRLTDGALVIDSKADELLDKIRKAQPNCECIMNFPSKSVEFDAQLADRYQKMFSGRKVVVYAGSMFSAKGLYRYIDLIDRLRNDNDSVLLVMVGMLRFGEEQSRIETYINKHRLANHVHFLPWIPYSDLIALLQTTRVGLALQDPDFFYFQLASVGNSRKPFTYMLAGVPLVVSLPAIGRFVEENRIGRKVNFNDLNSIHAAVKEILDNDDLYQDMHQRSKALIMSRYNWENEIIKAERVFQQAFAAIKE